jgi:glycosyltransferase involved in cell wall biosynthesis
MNMRKSISVVTAHYNEGDVFIELLFKWVRLLDRVDDIIYEVVVVDDNSESTQYFKLREEVDQISNSIVLLRNDINMGAGYSFMKGIDSARFEHIIIIDSDGQFNLEDCLSRLEYIYSRDCAVLFERTRKDDHWFLYFGSRLTNTFCNFFFGTRFKDFSSAFKFSPKSAFKKEKLLSKRMNYSVDHTYQLVQSGCQIECIQVSTNESKKNLKLTSKLLIRGLHRVYFIILLGILNYLSKRDEIIH